MEVTKLDIPGLMLFEPKVFGDNRGFFIESYNKERYKEAGLDVDFVQDNMSYSQKGVLRGLHCQNPNSQGKLVSVIQGAVYDVAVDIRLGSPTFGKSYGIELDSDKKMQFYVPPGFAHGFCVLTETALFAYKCTDFYHPENEFSVLWNDPDLKIDWPIENPSLSEKDKIALRLKDIDSSKLVKFNS